MGYKKALKEAKHYNNTNSVENDLKYVLKLGDKSVSNKETSFDIDLDFNQNKFIFNGVYAIQKTVEEYELIKDKDGNEVKVPKKIKETSIGTKNLYSVLTINPKTTSIKYEGSIDSKKAKDLKSKIEDDKTYFYKVQEIYYLLEEEEQKRYLEQLYSNCKDKGKDKLFIDYMSYMFDVYNESIDRNNETLEKIEAGEDFNKQRYDICYDRELIEKLEIKRDLINLQLGVENLKQANITRDKAQSRLDILERNIEKIRLMERERAFRYISDKNDIKREVGFLAYAQLFKENEKFLNEEIITDNQRKELKELEDKKLSMGLTQDENKRFLEISSEVESKMEQHLEMLKRNHEFELRHDIARDSLDFNNRKFYNRANIESRNKTKGLYEKYLEKQPYEYNFNPDELLDNIRKGINDFNQFHYEEKKIKGIDASEFLKHEEEIDNVYIEEKNKRDKYTNAIIENLNNTDKIINDGNLERLVNHLEEVVRTDEAYSEYLLAINCFSGSLKSFRGIDLARNAANEELLGKDYKTLTKDELFKKIKELKDEFKSDGFIINAKISQDIAFYNNPTLLFLNSLEKEINYSSNNLISNSVSNKHVKKDKRRILDDIQSNKLKEIHMEELKINTNLVKKLYDTFIKDADYLNTNEKEFIENFSIVKTTFNNDFIEEYKKFNDEEKNEVINKFNFFNYEDAKNMVNFIVYQNPDNSELLNSIVNKIYENNNTVGEIFLTLKESDISVEELFAFMKNTNILSNEEIKDFEIDFINKRDNIVSEIEAELRKTFKEDELIINGLNTDAEKLNKAILIQKIGNYNNYCRLVDTFKDTEYPEEIVDKFKVLFPNENIVSMNRFGRLIDMRDDLYSELEKIKESDNTAEIETISGKIVFLENSIFGYSENQATMINNPKDSILKEVCDKHKEEVEILLSKIKEDNKKYQKDKEAIENKLLYLSRGKIILDDGSKRNLTKGKEKEEEIKILKELEKLEDKYRKELSIEMQKISNSFIKELSTDEIVFEKDKASKELINNSDGKMHLIFNKLKDVMNDKENNIEITQEQIAIFAASLMYDNGIENMRSILLNNVGNKEIGLNKIRFIETNYLNEEEKEKLNIQRKDRILNSKAAKNYLYDKIKDSFGNLSEDRSLKVLECFEQMIDITQAEYPDMSFNTYVSLLKEYLNTNENIIIADSQRDKVLLESITNSEFSSVKIRNIELPNSVKIEKVISILNNYDNSVSSGKDMEESNLKLIDDFSNVFFNKDLVNLREKELEELKDIFITMTNNNKIYKSDFDIELSIGAAEELANIIGNYRDNNKVLCVSLYPSNVYLDEFSKNKDRVIKHYAEAVNESIISKLNFNDIDISDALLVLDNEIEKNKKERKIESGEDFVQKCEVYKSILNNIDYTAKYNELTQRERDYTNEGISNFIKDNIDINLLKEQAFVMNNPEHFKLILETYNFKDFKDNIDFKNDEISKVFCEYIRDNYSEKIMFDLKFNLNYEQLNHFRYNLNEMGEEFLELNEELNSLKNDMIIHIYHNDDYSEKYERLSKEDRDYQDEVLKNLIISKIDVDLLKTQKFVMENPETLKLILNTYDLKDFKDNLNLKNPENSQVIYNYLMENNNKKPILSLIINLDNEQLEDLRNNLKSIGSRANKLVEEFNPLKCDIIKSISSGEDYSKTFNRLSKEEKTSQNLAIKDLIENNISLDMLKNQKVIMENGKHLKSIFENYKINDFKNILDFEKTEISKAFYEYLKDNYSEKLLQELQLKLKNKQLEDFKNKLSRIDVSKDKFANDLIQMLTLESESQGIDEQKISKEQSKFIKTCVEIEKKCLDSKDNLDISKIIDIYNSLDVENNDDEVKRKHINIYVFSQDISIDDKEFKLSSDKKIKEDISSVFSSEDVYNVKIRKKEEAKNIDYLEKISLDMDVSYDVDVEASKNDFSK